MFGRTLGGAIAGIVSSQRRAGPKLIATLFLGLALSCLGAELDSPNAPEQTTSEFFSTIVGEWIGACEQTTNGERVGDKYFHAVIRRTDDNTFESRFEYYKLDQKTGKSVRVGQTTVTTTIAQDGTAQSQIIGSGTILVDNKPRNQRHQLTETVKRVGEDRLEGTGGGAIRVSGMPLGLGKNGKIKSAQTRWFLDGDTLTIHQSLKIEFRALIFKKSFAVECNYTARPGSDLAALMNGDACLSAKSETAEPGSS